jgi:hypothetical protein
MDNRQLFDTMETGCEVPRAFVWSLLEGRHADVP